MVYIVGRENPVVTMNMHERVSRVNVVLRQSVRRVVYTRHYS